MYTSTVKYFGLAIREFTPTLVNLTESLSDPARQEVVDLLEMLSDIATKIDRLNLDFSDPNRTLETEHDEVELNLDKDVLEILVRLTLRLLEKWKDELAIIKGKKYRTESKELRLHELERLIGPLEAFINAPSYLLHDLATNGPLVFPGEKDQIDTFSKLPSVTYNPIFPKDLLMKLPQDVANLCREFESNLQDQQYTSCMLLLRKMLPLAIVRKFQKENREDEIKAAGEYIETQALLGKVGTLLSQNRIYNEIKSYKLLIDSTQHNYVITIHPEDVPGPATAIRIMLEDLF